MKNVNRLHKLIFKWFKPQMMRLAYVHPIHPDNLELAFADNDGGQWWEPKEMPIVRKLYISSKFIQLYNGVSETDIALSIQAIEKAMNETVGGKMRPNIAMIGHICKKLSSRMGYLPDMEILYELAAMYFVYGNEKAEIVDMALMPTKIEILKKTDISKFFFDRSIDKLFPFLNDFEGTLQEVAEVAKVEAESYLKQIKDYLHGR